MPSPTPPAVSAPAVSTGRERSVAAAASAAMPLAAWVLPAITGALIALSFLDFRLHLLAWVAFVPLLRSIGCAGRAREALWIGLIAGMATNVPAFYWLVYTINVFGGFPIPIAVLFYLCLSLFSAAQFVLLTLALRQLGAGPLGLAAPVVWVALELVYPNLFPWRMANTQFHLPVLTQIGDVTGPFGLSFVILWVNSALAQCLGAPRRWAPLAAAAGALAAVVLYGFLRMPVIAGALERAAPVRVGLVQGNIGIHEKGDVALFDVNVERYRQLSSRLQDEVDVLVWPESVAQWWVPANASLLRGEDNPFEQARTFLVFGGLSFAHNERGEVEKYNSAFLMAPQGSILGRYDKQILLPFGEYLPGASLIPGLASLSPQTGDFTPGNGLATLDVPGRVRFAPLICYEDVPQSIARAMTRRGAQALLTMFNDAWFGRSVAPYQHEALALWRAIENRRYFVRVGNAGVSGVIDPFGRVVTHLGLFTEDVLRAEIRPLDLLTFYTRYGDLFARSVLLVALTWLAWTTRRSSAAAGAGEKARGGSRARGAEPPRDEPAGR